MDLSAQKAVTPPTTEQISVHSNVSRQSTTSTGLLDSKKSVPSFLRKDHTRTRSDNGDVVQHSSPPETVLHASSTVLCGASCCMYRPRDQTRKQLCTVLSVT